jgi:hypothetical protein
MVETVKFNVGGKHFEVSRALIDEHPDTMLAKMISEAWEKKNDEDTPLFIDRDGDIFSHVLNYLRYGSIDLPLCVPETMFQRELDYYGITPQDGTIKSMSFREFTAACKEQQKQSKAKLDQSQAELDHHTMICDLLAIAAKCNYEFSRSKSETAVCYLDDTDGSEFYERTRRYVYDTETMKLLENYCNDYFRLTVRVTNYCQFLVSAKK